MKIAYGTLFDARDVTRGSATSFFLTRELENQGHTVDYLGPIDLEPVPMVSRLFKSFALARGKRYRSFQDVFVARRIGKRTRDKIGSREVDVLLTNDFAIAGYTDVDCPIVIYTDSVFPSRYSSSRHPWWSDLSFSSVVSCQRVTKRGLTRASACIFPSDWAVESACEYSRSLVEPKCRRIEFGANLPSPPSRSHTEQRLASLQRLAVDLQILFVGSRDWQLKGGDIAIETTRLLRSRGILATLHLVGAEPPSPLHEPWIEHHGVLHKTQDHATLENLFERCDVILTPSCAEGFGIAFVEAAAYGMPSLSFDSGTGTNSAVRHGTTGLLLPLGSCPADFAQVIESWLDEPESYGRLVAGARRFYETTANWPVAVERLIAMIDGTDGPTAD